MTPIFHYMIDTEYYNYTDRGWTVDYMEEPVDSTAHIHFVAAPGKMNNRYSSLLLLGVF